ncbi:unnamed protein product [Amoebophrya sp. A120]|nr:unnamed protein product [Amoebophrya sp. A120]|eukprot:GSA120T00023152001.1
MSSSGDKTAAAAAQQNPLAHLPIPPFLTNKEQPIGWAFSSFLEFIIDSKRLLQRCTKPDAREFKKISVACAIGFAIMGFIGYVVKLVFIPINNIIVGMGM